MSHIKTVEAFGKLMGICTGYGGSFNPGRPNLQANAMSALTNNARQVMADVHAAQTEFDNATNTREVAFKDIQRLGTRIISTLKASGASKLTIEDAQASVRKLTGKRAGSRLPLPAEAATAPKPRTRTARGLDYASMAYHFAKLLETVSAEASYQPNEAELSVAGLTSQMANLQSLNLAVNSASAQLSNVRTKRNALLYADANNVVDIGNAVKQYVRAAYGPASEQNKEVKRIRFTKPTK